MRNTNIMTITVQQLGSYLHTSSINVSFYSKHLFVLEFGQFQARVGWLIDSGIKANHLHQGPGPKEVCKELFGRLYV